MYFVFILQHHLLKTYSLLLLVPRAMHLHPPAHPGIVSDALAERIAVEEPGMTATDQVSKEVQRQNVLHPTLVVPPRSHQRYSALQHSFQS